MKKEKEERIIDELLEAYAQDICEEECKEYAHLFEEDEQYLANKHLIKNAKYEKPRKKSSRYAKYVAAAAAVLIIFSVVIPTTEASAWRIWNLSFLFGNNEDHTVVKPEKESEFPQYYVSEIIDGYETLFENTDDSSIMIQYQNTEGKYILYMQVKKDEFVSQLDNEQRKIEEEVIGDFNVAVSKGNEDTIFEVVTDSVAIFVQTDAGYDVGKKFVENLKEL